LNSFQKPSALEFIRAICASSNAVQFSTVWHWQPICICFPSVATGQVSPLIAIRLSVTEPCHRKMPEQREQPEQSEQPEQREQPEQLEQREQLEQPEQREQPEQLEQREQPEQLLSSISLACASAAACESYETPTLPLFVLALSYLILFLPSRH
jgi:flagellar biosynthesis/type III secretory pathway M-ring protein FliF/YscJ